MIRRRGDARTVVLLSVVAIVSGVVAALTTIPPRRPATADGPVERPGAGEMAHIGRPAPGARRPPRLAPGSPPALENDPTAPGYDAHRLTEMAIPAREIFAAEPRDEAWAPVIEARISRGVQEDLAAVLPGAAVTAIECHTMTCRMELTASDRETLRKASQLFQYVPRAPRTDHVGSEGLKTIKYLTFDRETRDPTAHEAWYRSVRQLSLKRLRDNPRPASDPPVPAS